MKPFTIALTVSENLCTGCGVCVSMCPKNCITWVPEKGMYAPVIDQSTCIRCGLCARVCPGLGMSYESADPISAVTGTILESVNAWSKDSALRQSSASGGVVSTLVHTLLKQRAYDGAFVVNSYTYNHPLTTELITAETSPENWAKSSIPKSRYLPVSHEKAVSYIKSHPHKRLIIIATSCATRALQKALAQLNRPRDQYLFIGLFCDKVFRYSIWDYFGANFAEGKDLAALHFKNKESGGWPGNMKLHFEDGSFSYVNQKERTDMKALFMPERCLYCLDKLNVCADISIGDNFTDTATSPLGSNTVLIRTPQGQTAWTHCSPFLEYVPVSLSAVQDAQYIAGRINNLYFAELKSRDMKKRTGYRPELNSGIRLEADPKEYRPAWKSALSTLRVGSVYKANPEALVKHRKKEAKRKKSHGLYALFLRIYHALLRRI